MANQWGLDRPNHRKQQMKRELIGLVTGSVFLLTGTAFLFNHSLNTDVTAAAPPTATITAPATVTPTPPPVMTKTDSAVITNTTLPSATASTSVAPVVAATSVNDKPIVDTHTVVNPAVAPETESLQANPRVTESMADTTSSAANSVAPTTSETEATVTPPPVTEALPTTREVVEQAVGWIYVGQFLNGHWVEKGLSIGNELPVAGQTYAVSWGATVRSSPPGKHSGGKNAAVKGNIAAGKKVKVLQVKESGSKGHVWLEVAQ